MEIEIISEEQGNRTAKAVLSPKTSVVLKELGGGELRIVKRLSGFDLQLVADNMYLYALTEINSEKLVPVANEIHLQSRANKFTINEYQSLRQAYDEAFDIPGDEKND